MDIAKAAKLKRLTLVNFLDITVAGSHSFILTPLLIPRGD